MKARSDFTPGDPGLYSQGIETSADQLDLFAYVAETPAPAARPAEISPPALESPDLQWIDDDAPEEQPEPTIVYERNLRAKNYRLTLRRDGVAVATIPARGSEKAARAFVAQHGDWLTRVRERQRRRPRQPDVWTLGTHVLWRGEMTEIRRAVCESHRMVSVGVDVFRVSTYEGDLRATLEAAFGRRARIELPARTWELAAEMRLGVKKVAVRNQRSRWGSCTEGGVISLNWRLVQTPSWVSDYVIYHELMHLKEMNHSKRFWAAVAEVCPRWEEAEAWLKQRGSFLGL